jgi:hypothetical protein
MHLPDGTRTTTSFKNMSVFSPYFHHVFNKHRTTDPSLLKHIPQEQTLWELSNPNSWEEFYKAVTKLKKTKTPGLTRLSPEVFKAMSPSNLCHVYKHVNFFSLAMQIIRNSTKANACMSRKVATSQIQINEEE